ncbi:MAG: hypothetical protein RBT69_08980, partial [Spirochaetia bacterium]|nr:hypothetical protein [Spirochaetia bacterium]
MNIGFIKLQFIIEEIKIKDGFMKKITLLLAIIFLLGFGLLISCDNSSGDDDSGSEATKLGNTLTLSGTVDRTFTPPNIDDWAGSSFTNPLEATYTVFELQDGSDDTPYASDEDGNEELNISYSGTTHLDHLFSTAGGSGLTSSNPAAEITTAIIEVRAGAGDYNNDDIAFGNFSAWPAEWYIYWYSTAKTTLDGTRSDSGETYSFDNVTIFEGWNRLIKSTSDGENFTYSGGTISGGHWTYID